MNTAVGTIWEASKLGGLNIMECLQPRKSPREKSCSRNETGSRPSLLMGKADDTEEETGMGTLWDPSGYGTRHLRKDSRRYRREDPVGSRGWQQPAKTLRTRLKP